MKHLSVLVVFGYMLVAWNTPVGFAAPQVLAAVPVGEPYQLKCHDGVCEAEFSAICLQPKRRAPDSDTAYQVYADDQSAVKLTAQTNAGESIELPAGLLSVSSVRSQTTIRFTLEQNILKDKQLRSVSVGLKRMVTLLPEPVADDPSPQTTADIRYAVTGVRRIGEIWGENNADNMTIARITDRIGNVLSTRSERTSEEIENLIQDAIQHEPDMSIEAVDSARRLVAVCQRRSRFTDIRVCLAEFHDQIMLGLNGKYWSALIPGS
jgi:hypothetical protein